MPTIKIHMNRRAVRQCTAEGTTQPRKERIGSRLKLSHITSIAMFADHPGNLASVRKNRNAPEFTEMSLPILGNREYLRFYHSSETPGQSRNCKIPNRLWKPSSTNIVRLSNRIKRKGNEIQYDNSFIKKNRTVYIYTYIYIYKKTYQIIRRVYFIYRKTLAKKHYMKNQNPVHW